jgi:membrane associated rhomboid family serine protease
MYGNEYMMRRPLGVAVKSLLIANAAVFLVEFLLRPYFVSRGIPGLAYYFGLHSTGSVFRLLWQPVTYLFLHADFWHILFNMLGLFFLGVEVESVLGARRFLQLYFLCGILGGIGWLLLSGHSQAVCIGASGAVLGVAGAFAGMFPQRRITMLVYFVFPVTMTALTMALVFAGFSLLMMVFGRDGGVAHAAHLAGGIAGFIYGKNLRRQGFRRRSTSVRNLSGFFSDLRARYRRSRYRVVSMDDRPVDQRQVDAVLDKIRHHGINSLTGEEKSLLDRASRKNKN